MSEKDAGKMFAIYNPEMYGEIILTRNPKPCLKTHAAVPVKKIGDTGEPEYLAMKLKDEMP